MLAKAVAGDSGATPLVASRPEQRPGHSAACLAALKKKREGKKKKQKREGPKHPRSAYVYFVAEKRAALDKGRSKAVDGASLFRENAKVVGRLWRRLSEEGRAPFAVKALADKQRPVRRGIAGRTALVLTHTSVCGGRAQVCA